MMRFYLLSLAAWASSWATPKALEAASVEALASALATERPNIEARSPFVAEDLLSQLLELGWTEIEGIAGAVGMDAGSIHQAIREVRLMEDYRARAEESSSLLESGCLPARPSGFEFSLTDPETPQSSFSELLSRAYSTLLVRVAEVRSGYYGSVLGTRVRVEVVEVLGDNPLELEAGDVLEYYQAVYDLRFGDQEICAQRPGFEVEAVEDLFLLLAAPPTRSQAATTFVPSLAFPVGGGEVKMQPYPFLSSDTAADLEGLRRGLEGGRSTDG